MVTEEQTQETVVDAVAVQTAMESPIESVYAIYWRDNPGQVMEVHINDVDVDADDDVRTETASVDTKDTDFKLFVKTIQANGAVPIDVRIVDGRLKCVDGRRRLAALRQLGRTSVRVLPALDSGAGVSRHDALVRALALNVHKAMTPIDKLQAIKKVQAAATAAGVKITNKAIADAVGMSAGSLTGYLSLDKYDADSQELIASNKVAYGAAIALMAEQGPEGANSQIKALAAQADAPGGKGKVSHSDAKAASRSARNSSGGSGSKYALTSSQASADIEKYLKGITEGTAAEKAAIRKSPEFRIALALKDWLRMGNPFEKVLGTIFNAWEK